MTYLVITIRYFISRDNCHDILFFNCCKTIVRTSCSYKLLQFCSSRYLHWNTLKYLCLKMTKFRKHKFHQKQCIFNLPVRLDTP